MPLNSIYSFILSNPKLLEKDEDDGGGGDWYVNGGGEETVHWVEKTKKRWWKQWVNGFTKIPLI